MRAANDLLSQYAQHHRDQRNIASHFVGVPMVVFALGVLFAHPNFVLGHLQLSPAWLAFAAASAWYLTRGNLMLGLAVSTATGLLVLAAQQAAGGIGAWLGWGVCMFAIGCGIQAVGHWYEGHKPTFVGDVASLLVGPMFVTAEAMFMLGWNKPLMAEIERRAGPTTLRDLAKIA